MHAQKAPDFISSVAVIDIWAVFIIKLHLTDLTRKILHFEHFLEEFFCNTILIESFIFMVFSFVLPGIMILPVFCLVFFMLFFIRLSIRFCVFFSLYWIRVWHLNLQSKQNVTQGTVI